MESSPLHWRLSARSPAWRPPTDVYETEDFLVVRIEVAGMRENDFSIEVTDRQLLVRGLRSDIPEKRAYHQMEIRWGEFLLDFELHIPILADQVEALYQNGILIISLPKALPRRISVEG